MTTNLRYGDIKNCCEICSNINEACIRDNETNCETLKENNGGTCIGGVNNEGFTEMMKEQCGKTCADEFCSESVDIGNCDCELDYCDLKETMCPSITDRYECINRGCRQGPVSNNYQCVNPDQIPDTKDIPGLDCNDPEFICNMDKNGTIIYGKCIEGISGLKTFVGFNGKCVSDDKPINHYCSGVIPQLDDPCVEENVTTTGDAAAPTNTPNVTTTGGGAAPTNTPNVTTTGDGAAPTNTPNVTTNVTTTATGNGTTEEPEGSNSDDMNNYANNNADNSELIYFFHEEGEDGETLYEYQFNNEEALKERRDIENASEASYDRHLGKKVLTNDTGLQYLYDPYTDSLTSFNDSKNIKKRVRKMEDRMKFLEDTVHDATSIDLKNSNDVRNKLVFPVLNSNTKDVVYLSNDFGNSEHPELNTEINNSPKNTVGEVKVTSEEANKILEEQKNENEDENENENENENEDETGSESVESPEEEVEKKGLSLTLKIIIILVVLSVLGLVVFLLNKFGVLHKLTKKSNNLMKNNSFNLNKATNNILKNLPSK